MTEYKVQWIAYGVAVVEAASAIEACAVVDELDILTLRDMSGDDYWREVDRGSVEEVTDES